MKKFLKRYWLAVALVALFIVIIVFFVSRKEDAPPTSTPIPTTFDVINTYPREGVHEVVIANLAVEFIFSKEVDLAKTAIKVSPTSNIDISYGDTQKSVVIRPESEWEMDTEYTFEVRAVSQEGETLEDPYIYEVEFTPLTESGLEENY